jgi:hypothetical protein
LNNQAIKDNFSYIIDNSIISKKHIRNVGFKGKYSTITKKLKRPTVFLNVLSNSNKKQRVLIFDGGHIKETIKTKK